MEGGNPSVLSKFSSGKRNGSNTMHNFQSLFCAETGAGCGLVRHLAADGPGHFDTHLLVLVICRGGAPPSCCARPFGRLKAPLGLSLLRFAAQTRTTLFLLCTKSCIVWRKIGVWCSFRWKFVKRKSLKLLGTSRSFRLCHLKIGNLLFNRLHRGDVARNSPVFVQQAPTTSTIPGDFLKNPPTSSNSVHESCVQFWSQPFFDGA